ncbi:MAG: PAS domain-containing protein [Bacteroidetes bacterium]|nr:PAS domain-containing protein [Bacteroidota bacterium]MBR3090987.1 PAS domain-containing protein [Bacteroidota bacterium]
MDNSFFNEIDAAITICDLNFKIVYMNNKSKNTFQNKKIGDDILACHNPHSIEIMNNIISTKKANVYSIDKNGIKKIIYQTPWLENNEVKGLIEFSFVVPVDMPNYKRN